MKKLLPICCLLFLTSSTFIQCKDIHRVESNIRFINNSDDTLAIIFTDDEDTILHYTNEGYAPVLPHDTVTATYYWGSETDYEDSQRMQVFVCGFRDMIENSRFNTKVLRRYRMVKRDLDANNQTLIYP